MRASMSRGVANSELRVWVPQGAELLFVKQVSPTLEDLTSRRTVVNPLTGAYPTGAWSDESRDYHVAVRLPARTLGQEQLAARVQFSLGGDPVAQALVKAKWSNDDSLTTRIDPAVAAYTGQAELATVIQEGLAAKAAGQDDVATVQARARRAARRRHRQRRDDDPPEEGRRDRRRRHRHRPAQEGGVEDRRDVARHGVDEDEPGAPMSAVCPNGHTSEAEDYCDTCGSPIDARAPSPTALGRRRRRPAERHAVVDRAPRSTSTRPRPLAPGRARWPWRRRRGPRAPRRSLECPNCPTENPDGALFCEACGYDFTTGAMPRDPCRRAGRPRRHRARR